MQHKIKENLPRKMYCPPMFWRKVKGSYFFFVFFVRAFLKKYIHHVDIYIRMYVYTMYISFY